MHATFIESIQPNTDCTGATLTANALYDRARVAPLKDQSVLHSDSQKKVKLLSKPFSSVFTVDHPASDNKLTAWSKLPSSRASQNHSKGCREAAARDQPK